MAQIAQQDNLVVTSTTPIATLDTEAKKKLIACIEAGTINDVLVVTPEVSQKTNTSKVVAWFKDITAPSTPKYKAAVVDCNTAALKVIDLN